MEKRTSERTLVLPEHVIDHCAMMYASSGRKDISFEDFVSILCPMKGWQSFRGKLVEVQ